MFDSRNFFVPIRKLLSLFSMTIGVAGVISAVVASPLSAAAPYPSRVIRLVNPYAAGGPADQIAREVATGISAELGRPVIVDSKPGGGTIIGADFVAKSAPDGYTILLGTIAPLVIQPLIATNLPYSVARDLTLIGMFATVPNLISVNSSLPVKTLAQLITYAKKNPGTLNYASAGIGSGPHLGGELFKHMTDTELTHVAYKGASPAAIAIVSGEVQVGFVNITPQLPHVKSGRLRPIAIAAEMRSSLLPDVPTVAEAGLPGFISESWYGLVVPAKTPPEIREILRRTLFKVMASPERRARLAAAGAEITLLEPMQFAAYVDADRKRLTPIVQSLNLKP